MVLQGVVKGLGSQVKEAVSPKNPTVRTTVILLAVVSTLEGVVALVDAVVVNGTCPFPNGGTVTVLAAVFSMLATGVLAAMVAAAQRLTKGKTVAVTLFVMALYMCLLLVTGDVSKCWCCDNEPLEEKDDAGKTTYVSDCLWTENECRADGRLAGLITGIVLLASAGMVLRAHIVHSWGTVPRVGKISAKPKTLIVVAPADSTSDKSVELISVTSVFQLVGVPKGKDVTDVKLTLSVPLQGADSTLSSSVGSVHDGAQQRMPSTDIGDVSAHVVESQGVWKVSTAAVLTALPSDSVTAAMVVTVKGVAKKNSVCYGTWCCGDPIDESNSADFSIEPAPSVEVVTASTGPRISIAGRTVMLDFVGVPYAQPMTKENVHVVASVDAVRVTAADLAVHGYALSFAVQAEKGGGEVVTGTLSIVVTTDAFALRMTKQL